MGISGAYLGFKDKINGFWGIGGTNEYTPPPPSPTVPEVMASQEATLRPTLELTPTPVRAIHTQDKFEETENEINKEVEVMAELDQQIQDFLNSEGDYTDEKIQEVFLKRATVDPKREMNLGIVNLSQYSIDIESIPIKCIEKDGYLVLLSGFTDENNKRIVLLVKVPLKKGNEDDNFLLEIQRLQDRRASSGFPVEIDTSTNEFLEYMEKFKNEPVIYTFPIDEKENFVKEKLQ